MADFFRVVSYNILANVYIRPEWYAHVEPEVLQWESRKHALADHLARFNAAILCLQEVEEDAYALLEHKLGAQGYTGVYAKKAQNRPDGCATFFPQEGLRFAGSEVLYYHDGSPETAPSGHLALILSFASEFGNLRVVNTHLRWDRPGKPAEEHVGYRQLRELITERLRAEEAVSAWIVCGDFNAAPDSPLVDALRQHGFEDAYAGHAQPTCNPNRKAKRIDYLFYTNSLRATPMTLTEIDDLTPLPSRQEPSDHLAVSATFAWT